MLLQLSALSETAMFVEHRTVALARHALQPEVSGAYLERGGKIMGRARGQFFAEKGRNKEVRTVQMRSSGSWQRDKYGCGLGDVWAL